MYIGRCRSSAYAESVVRIPCGLGVRLGVLETEAKFSAGVPESPTGLIGVD